MNIIKKYRAWSKMRREIAVLEAMDDRQLEDIGLARWEIRDAVRGRYLDL